MGDECFHFLCKPRRIDLELPCNLVEQHGIVETLLNQLPDAVTGLVQVVNLIGLQVNQDRTVFNLSTEYVVAWPQCGSPGGGHIELRARPSPSQSSPSKS